MSEQTFKCGYIAIVGRPNVGKSTLLNHLIQQKISITSRKPQTTRQNITGIKTLENAQMIFVDTPGMHLKESNAVNRYMNRAAHSAANGVDVAIFVVDRDIWTDEDALVAERLKSSGVPVLVVLNKFDQCSDQASLMPHVARLHDLIKPDAIIPISALKNMNLDRLEDEIIRRLPLAEAVYPEDQVTDKSSRFLVAELIREKIIRQLGAEIPYQIAVDIEQFEAKNNVIHISGLILVEREGQKRIVIGDQGERLKSIGKAARLDMEKMLDSKVMLKLWVKVKSGWSDDERVLRNLGFSE